MTFSFFLSAGVSEINRINFLLANVVQAPVPIIDLSRMNLEEVPSELVGTIMDAVKSCHIPPTVSLNLSHNRLSSIPASFARSTAIIDVNFRDNPLKDIPKGLIYLFLSPSLLEMSANMR